LSASNLTLSGQSVDAKFVRQVIDTLIVPAVQTPDPGRDVKKP
jgi:hypothetical protein